MSPRFQPKPLVQLEAIPSGPVTVRRGRPPAPHAFPPGEERRLTDVGCGHGELPAPLL